MPEKLLSFFASIADLIRDKPSETLLILKDGAEFERLSWKTPLNSRQKDAMELHYRNREENEDAGITFIWNPPRDSSEPERGFD